MGFMVWVVARLWRGLVTEAQWWCGQTRLWVLVLVVTMVVVWKREFMVVWVSFGFESMALVVGGCKRDEEEKIEVNIYILFYFTM